MKRTGNSKIAVVGWGRGMGHKGHMYLADAVITQAINMKADPYFFVSKTVGKDDPIFPEEKVRIYQKVFPQYAPIFEPQGNLNQALTELAQLGYQGVVVVVGADQKQAFQYLEKPNKEGVPVYQTMGLKKLKVISRQETNSKFAQEEGPRATPMREILLDPNASEEDKFNVWRRDMPEQLSDRDVLDVMNKAESRLLHSSAPKASKVKQMSQKAAKLKEAILSFKVKKPGQSQPEKESEPLGYKHLFKPDEPTPEVPKQYHGWEEYDNEKNPEKLAEFAPDEGGGSRKFIPWPEFIEQLKQILHKDFDCVENVVKTTIKARFVPHDPMEYGPTMLYSYYETRAGGRNKGAISTRGSIQIGKYTGGGFTGQIKDKLLTTFSLLKGHPFERHFDLTFDNIYKIANIIQGNTEGALEFKPEQQVNEFAPSDDGDNGQEDMFFKYAKLWYNGNEQVQQRIIDILDKAGWEIGEIESEEGGAFIVKAGDEDGGSYMGWSAEELEGLDETKVSKYKDLGATKDTTHFIKNVTTGEIVSPHRGKKDAEDALVAHYRGPSDGNEYKIVRARKDRQLDEFAPGNGDDGLPYAEYVVYHCNPEDQFDWIGGPLYQTDSMGMAHKYAYEKYIKHRPKAFMVFQPATQASRGNYGVKGQSDEDYLDE